jgi:subtilisin family serine protease
MRRPATGQGRSGRTSAEARACPGGRKAVVRPRLEPLEDRCLLSSSPAYDPSHVLVRLRDGETAVVGQALAPGLTVSACYDLVPGLYEVDLAPGLSVPQALAGLRADPRVLEADADYAVSVERTPNDFYFSRLWGLNNTGQNAGKVGADIDALAAWDVTTGSYRTVVSLMDTGIDYNHPDLYRNVWVNQAEIPASRKARLVDVDGDGVFSFADLADPRNQGAFKITDLNKDGRIDAQDILTPMVKDASGHDTGAGGWADGVSQDGDTAHLDDLVGWNFVNNTNRPFDDNGHGTHVAGILGATGNNGVGVVGVDWQVSMMAVKFMDAGGNGAVGAVIAGLQYAVAHGATISNNSWSGSGNNSALQAAITAARDRGHIFVASASNNASNNDTQPAYPGSFPLDNIVTVAALDNKDQLASFSNYGAKTIDLGAPGVAIFSTLPNNGYGTLNGTSMSTPYVTGTIALVRTLHPTWSYRQVIDQVLATVDPVASLQGKTVTGGRVNAAAAVGAGVVPQQTPPHIISAVNNVGTTEIGTIRVTFDRVMNPASFTAADVTLATPDGRTVAPQLVRVISSSGGRAFDVFFPVQTVLGIYALRIGPDVTDTSGVRMAVYTATFPVSGVTPNAPHIISAVNNVGTTEIGTVRVTFDRVMNPASFTAADVTLATPDGRTVAPQLVRVISSSGGRAFDVFFPVQTVLGIYTLRIGPDVTDTSGVRMAPYTETLPVTGSPLGPAVSGSADETALDTLFASDAILRRTAAPTAWTIVGGDSAEQGIADESWDELSWGEFV